MWSSSREMFLIVLSFTGEDGKDGFENKFASVIEIIDSTYSAEYKGAAFVAL
jgi:hypothetical protein